MRVSIRIEISVEIVGEFLSLFGSMTIWPNNNILFTLNSLKMHSFGTYPWYMVTINGPSFWKICNDLLYSPIRYVFFYSYMTYSWYRNYGTAWCYSKVIYSLEFVWRKDYFTHDLFSNCLIVRTYFETLEYNLLPILKGSGIIEKFFVYFTLGNDLFVFQYNYITILLVIKTPRKFIGHTFRCSRK